MNTSKVPTWYWIVAIAIFLWNIVGVYSFYMQAFITDAQLSELPINEQKLYAEYPMWTNIIFAIAVLSGIMGSLALLMQQKWAKTAFIISLVAILVQMIHSLFFTSAMDVYGVAHAVAMPTLVILMAIFLVWYSNYCINKGWLK